MASKRPIYFRTGYIYHVFNRGVERRNLFQSTRDRERFVLLLEYYRFADIPKSFSHYLNLSLEEHKKYSKTLQSLPHAIDILAYCLMPNHFHLLLRQQNDHGIIEAISNISNGYAKYFNTKYQRVGPLFQGPFKAVRIESDEQLLHVSRYIHLNPVVSGVISESKLFTYPWSSLATYLGTHPRPWVENHTVLEYFRNIEAYREFVNDQVAYGKELEKIKHLTLEEV